MTTILDNHSDTVARPNQHKRQSRQEIKNSWYSHGQISTGQVQPLCTEIDLAKLVSDVCKELEEFAMERGSNLVYKNIPASSYVIAADPILLKKAISNLISNSLILSKNDLVAIKLNWESHHEKGAGVKLSITGNYESVLVVDYIALFMKPEESEKNVDRTEYDAILSFSMADELVKLHDGEVNIISKDDSQSKYLVFLPQ